MTERSELAPGDAVCLVSYRHGITRVKARVEKVTKTRIVLDDGSAYRVSDGLPVGSDRPGVWDAPVTLEPFDQKRREQWTEQWTKQRLARTRSALADAAASATQEQVDACLAILSGED